MQCVLSSNMTRFVQRVCVLVWACVLGPLVNAADAVTKRGSLVAYDAVIVRVPSKLDLIQSAKTAYVISAEPSVVNVITFKIHDRRLTIDAAHNFESKQPIHITLYLPLITSMEIQGSAEVTSKVPTHPQGFDFVHDGAGNATLLGVHSKSVSARLKGASSIAMQGKVEVLDIDLSGSGDVRLQELHATDAKVAVTGSGDAWVSVSKSLHANIAGTGEIRYSGSPRVVKNITGVGEVRQSR